jgi:hypothetical protein
MRPNEHSSEVFTVLEQRMGKSFVKNRKRNQRIAASIVATLALLVGVALVALPNANAAEPEIAMASGGDVSFIANAGAASGWDEIHTFKSANAHQFKPYGAISDARVLVIAGGGAGGAAGATGATYTNATGGGGGAGEMIDKTGIAFAGGTSYTVTVGEGGVSKYCDDANRPTYTDSTMDKHPTPHGKPSSIEYGTASKTTLSAAGGGQGGGHIRSICNTWGATGGSGGGNSWGGTRTHTRPICINSFSHSKSL